MDECFALIHIGRLGWIDVMEMTRREMIAFAERLRGYQEAVKKEMDKLRKR